MEGTKAFQLTVKTMLLAGVAMACTTSSTYNIVCRLAPSTFQLAQALTWAKKAFKKATSWPI
jgi:hypothetical protein